MSVAKTILILGGGVGGLVAANRLRKALPAQHRVILVERETGPAVFDGQGECFIEVGGGMEKSWLWGWS